MFCKIKLCVLIYVYNYFYFCYILLVVPLERMNKVDTKKHKDMAVLIYLFSLLLFVIMNLINNINFVDLGYLVVVLCCVLKLLIVIRNKGK